LQIDVKNIILAYNMISKVNVKSVVISKLDCAI